IPKRKLLHEILELHTSLKERKGVRVGDGQFRRGAHPILAAVGVETYPLRFEMADSIPKRQRQRDPVRIDDVRMDIEAPPRMVDGMLILGFQVDQQDGNAAAAPTGLFRS